jgi:ACS family hexuronate transporter-like MFS transporter
MSGAAPGDTSQGKAAVTPGGHYRWWICGLLFFGTVINYIDRQVISILKPTLMSELHWDQNDYGNIVFAFQAAYAVGYGGAGWFMDRVGIRLGYGLVVFFWSIAAVMHGAVRSVMGFSLVRVGLGLAEGGNFPAAIKAVAEWFPRKERALATGIFNAGSNVAVILTPLLVPWITVRWGWPSAFYITGGLGFFWMAAWWAIYREPGAHPRVSPQERAYIASDPPEASVKVSWLKLLAHRQTWAFAAGISLTSPVWWFYLFWVPGFLHEKHGLSMVDFGPPLIVIYLIADIGSVGGGWLSMRLLARGWSLNKARKGAMLVCALLVVPVFAASRVADFWTATLLIGIAAAAHQGFAANLYTLVSDTVPRQVVSTVVGIGGMTSAIVGMFSAKLIGAVLSATGSYVILFACASGAYVVALLAIHLINPRLEPMAMPATVSSSSK